MKVAEKLEFGDEWKLVLSGGMLVRDDQDTPLSAMLKERMEKVFKNVQIVKPLMSACQAAAKMAKSDLEK